MRNFKKAYNLNIILLLVAFFITNTGYERTNTLYSSLIPKDYHSLRPPIGSYERMQRIIKKTQGSPNLITVLPEKEEKTIWDKKITRRELLKAACLVAAGIAGSEASRRKAIAQALEEDSQDLTFTYEGWLLEEEEELRKFVSQFYKRIRSIFGTTLSQGTIKIVKNEYPSGPSFQPIEQIINLDGIMDSEDKFWLAHEMAHSFFGDFSPMHNAYSEGMAQAIAYIVAGSYLGHREGIFGEFETMNKPQLAVGNGMFHLDWSGERRLRGLRYDMAAYVWRKFFVLDVEFFVKFKTLLYQKIKEGKISLNRSKLWSEGGTVQQTDALNKIVAEIIPGIEGLPTLEWLSNQYVFKNTSSHVGYVNHIGYFDFDTMRPYHLTFYRHGNGGPEIPAGGKIVDGDYDFRKAHNRFLIYNFKGEIIFEEDFDGTIKIDRLGELKQYGGRIKMVSELKPEEEEESVVRDVTMYAGTVAYEKKGLFGIVKENTGKVFISGPRGAVTVDVVNGAFTTQSVNPYFGRESGIYTMEYTSSDNSIIRKTIIKHKTAGYFVNLINRPGSMHSLVENQTRSSL